MKRAFRNVSIAILALSPLAASAITLLPKCTDTGDCGVTDILAVLLNVAEYLLGVSGAVALAFFVYGGFTFILAAGDKKKVGEAFGILKSAVIGIAIIFFSGILVRFTTEALTGGTSKIPTIGETCKTGPTPESDPDGDGLWISVPPGIDDSGKLIPESIVCVVKKNGCSAYNALLERRHRTDTYSCKPISGATTCLRGLCPESGADVACCR